VRDINSRTRVTRAQKQYTLQTHHGDTRNRACALMRKLACTHAGTRAHAQARMHDSVLDIRIIQTLTDSR